MGLVLAYKKSTAVPQFSGNPSYSGGLLVGQTLTGSYEITNAVSNVSVAWWSYSTVEKFDGIQRSTSNAYTILEADAGRYLEFVVTATNNAGESIGYSGLTPQITGEVYPTPEFQVGATVAGQPKVGATLVANYVALNFDSVSIQWQSSSDNIEFANIDGATSQAFVPTGDEQGDYIRVAVTATNSTGSTVSTSAATGQVAAADAALPPPAGAPAGAIPLNAENVASRTLNDGAVLLKDQGAYYYCVGDMTFSGAAFVVNHSGITLDLNGCTVTYNTSGGASVWGSPLVEEGATGWISSYDANRRAAYLCKANFNGVWAPSQPEDSAYDGQTTSGGQTVTAAWNRDNGNFVIKNGTLKEHAGGHLTHSLVWARPNTVTTTWTVSGLRVEAGDGIHARCVVGRVQLRAYDSVFISKTVEVFASTDRLAIPAAIQCSNSAVVVERCAVIGGNCGVNTGSNSVVRNTFISNTGFVTNGWGYIQNNRSNILVEDCVVLPLNGRGVYFDQNDARSCTARNNVILGWEHVNTEYPDGLTPGAYKLRSKSQGHLFYGNHCLGVAGGRDGDAQFPVWQAGYPVQRQANVRRSAAATLWGAADGSPTMLRNYGYGNILRAIHYGTFRTAKIRAAPLSLGCKDLVNGGSRDDYYGNECYSNFCFVDTNNPDQVSYSIAAHTGNSFYWETGLEAYAAFTSAADDKLASLGLTPMVLAVAEEQKAVIYADLSAAINQEDAGLREDRAFWTTDYYSSGLDRLELVTLTDSTFGPGVDPTTVMTMVNYKTHPVAFRIAKTHRLQILDGASPVTNATVTVTPDQINTHYDDVTTTTTDASGFCTITYYETAMTRASGSATALVEQTGTSSTVAVDGVGSASVNHASLGATLDIGA